MTTEDNAKLLVSNKEEQVLALQALNIPAEADTPLSELADYTKWAGGLLDICYACAPTDGSGIGTGIGKGTSSLSYFTPEQWSSLSGVERDKHTLIGIRLRAENKQFLISLMDISKTSQGTSSETMLWSSTGDAIPNLKDYGLQSKGIFDDFNAKGMTDDIISYHAGKANSWSAAGYCRQYKAADVDPVEWSMATVAHMVLIFKYRKEINQFLATHVSASSPIRDATYWTANEFGSYYAWYINMSSGALAHSHTKGNRNYSVRAVSAI